MLRGEEIEKSVREHYLTKQGDAPGLPGAEFLCRGSQNKANASHVGIALRFKTLEYDYSLFEDRLEKPLYGCSHFDGKMCNMDNGECIMPGVVTMTEFRERQNMLKKLELTSTE